MLLVGLAAGKMRRRRRRRRRRRKCKIPLVWGFIVWTCEVVYEFCLLKWGENVQNLMFLRAECLWLLWLFLWGTLKSAKLLVLYRYGACPRQGVTWRDGIPAIPIYSSYFRYMHK
uniref:DAD domain-containing protein n=1 Tax=Anguilla anguilla TaxID=7936 RepID=A0A0E9Y1H9_ANGAN